MDYEGGLPVRRQAGIMRRVAPWLQILIQVAFAGALLVLLLWRVDLASVRDEVKGASFWWFPLAFATNLIADYFRAIRWQVFLAPLKRLGLPFLWGVSMLGVACNMALPMRAGEFVRLQIIRKRTGLEAAPVIATIVSEKLMDIVAFSLFLVVGMLLFEDARFLWPLALAYVVVLIGGIAAARWWAHRSGDESGLEGQPDGRWRFWIWQQVRAAGSGLGVFRSGRAFTAVSAASVVAWLIEAVVYYACGKALGIDLNPAVYLLIVVAATVAISLPITTGGLGVFEVAITGLLVAFGVGKSQAAAYAIVSHVLEAFPYFVAGPLTALALRVKPSDVFFVRRPSAEAGPAVVA